MLLNGIWGRNYLRGTMKKKNTGMVSDKWKAIFNKPQSSFIWTLCIVGSLIAIVAVRIFIYGHEDATEEKKIISSIVYAVLPDIVNAIASGLLGAAMLNLVYREYENRKIRLIESLAYNDMLAGLFAALDKIKGKARFDENIQLSMEKYKDENGKQIQELILIRIKYKFYTYLRENSIKCIFDRIQGSDNVGDYTAGVNEELLKYEFYWGNDETGFPLGIVNNNSYKIYDVSIGTCRENLEMTHNTEKFGADKSRESYKFSIPEDEGINIKEKQMIMFTVEFPMERESILMLTHELPTENVVVDIDYSNIMDDFYVYSLPVSGSIPVKKHFSEQPGKLSFDYNGWLMPKAGYIISWWDNPKPTTGET